MGGPKQGQPYGFMWDQHETFLSAWGRHNRAPTFRRSPSVGRINMAYLSFVRR